MAQQDDLLQNNTNDDDDSSTQGSDDAVNDDVASAVAPIAATDNPIADLEKATEEEEEFSEPEGLDDSGYVDDANWEALEVERGAGRGKDDDEDLTNLGMHIEEAPASGSRTDDVDDLDNLGRFNE